MRLQTIVSLSQNLLRLLDRTPLKLSKKIVWSPISLIASRGKRNRTPHASSCTRRFSLIISRPIRTDRRAPRIFGQVKMVLYISVMYRYTSLYINTHNVCVAYMGFSRLCVCRMGAIWTWYGWGNILRLHRHQGHFSRPRVRIWIKRQITGTNVVAGQKCYRMWRHWTLNSCEAAVAKKGF